MDKLGLIKETPYGVVETEEGKLVVPREEEHKYVTNLHYLTHLGAKKLKGVVRSSDYYVTGLSDLAEEIVKSCKACAMSNAGHSIYTPRKRLRGYQPGAYWEVDFTEIKPARYDNQYLLVFTDNTM